MNTNVKIVGVGTYHPLKKVGNEFFIDHFKEKFDKDITGFLESLGKKERFLVEDVTKENSLTMALEASRKALQNAKISVDQLDMIVFVSDTPEYTAPTNALYLNNILGAKNAHTVYDMNANCVGMIVAMDQVSRVIKTDSKIKYSLVVGSLFVSSIARDDDMFTYAAVADAAAAVILERTEDPSQIGFIDSGYFTDSSFPDMVLSPVCGMSKLRLDDTVDAYERKLYQKPLDVSFFSTNWVKLITTLLNRYGYCPQDIDYFFFSQYAKSQVQQTAELMDVNFDERFIYIGDIYGYTGTTSPVVAYHEAAMNGILKPGQKYIFCSVGCGYQMSAILYQS